MDTSGERLVPDAKMGEKIEMEHMHRYHAIAPFLKGKRVLDAACGAGYGSKILSFYASYVCGIDIDEEAIKYASSNYKKDNIDFLKMSVTELCFPEGSFDAVVSYETIEHLPENQQMQFLKEIKKVLKPDGILVMSTPDLDSFMKKSNGLYYNPYHKKEYNKAGYEKLLGAYFSNVSIFYQEVMPSSYIHGKALCEINHVDDFNCGDYMIAVCSDSALKDIDIGSVFLPKTNSPEIKSFLYVNTGSGYSETQKICLVNNPEFDGTFSFTAAINYDNVASLRFDPADFPCMVSLKVSDENGKVIPFMATNAQKIINDTSCFYHWDSQYEFSFKDSKCPEMLCFSGKITKIADAEIQNYLYSILNDESSLCKTKQDQEKMILDLESEKKKLLDEQDLLQQKMDSVLMELTKEKQRTENLEALALDLKSSAVKKDEEISLLSLQNKNMSDENSRLESELENNILNLKSKEEELNISKSLCDSLRKNLNDKEQYLNSIMEENKKALDEKNKALDEKNKSLDENSRKIEELNHQIEMLNEQVNNLNAAKNDLENQCRKEQMINSDIINSRSWRMTRGLRSMGRFARKVKRHTRNHLLNSWYWNHSKIVRPLWNKHKTKKENRQANQLNAQSSVTDNQQLINYRGSIENITLPKWWIDDLSRKVNISIVMAVRNLAERRDLFIQMLKSLEDQTFSSFESVFVTTAEEMDEVKKITASVLNGKKLVYVFMDESCTDIRQYWKKGAEASTGSFIGFAEQEDFFDPDALAFMADVIHEEPDSAVVTVRDDVIYNGRKLFPDDKLGLEFQIGGENSLIHFSLFPRKSADAVLMETDVFLSGLTKENVRVIPAHLYHQNAVADVWNRDFDVRCIAFYLPQFHEIPENNEWWGKGFTEWVNVKKAKPLFDGHHQPRIPGPDLGYYDLGDENGREVQMKQIEMAKKYGLQGFCYYYYWFDDGRRLLEKPLDRMLKDKDMDFPFCLCWANENWTKAWDGLKSEVLMPQTYKEGFEIQFVHDILPYIQDERYIKVNGVPYILIYNLADIPNCGTVLARMREEFAKCGFPRVHISAVRRTLEASELSQSGYTIDSLTDFPPHLLGLAGVDSSDESRYGLKPGQVKDYHKAADFHANMPKQLYTYFRTSFLEWDNTARRGDKAYLFVNFNFDDYKRWLYGIRRYTLRQNRPGENLVFINAWNEWAEGSVLEPDDKYGYGALEATKEVLEMK